METFRAMVIPVPRLRSGWVDENIRAWNRGDDRCRCGYSLSLLRDGDGPSSYFGVAGVVREVIRSHRPARPAGSRTVCHGVPGEGADRCRQR
jgi:hypothetical protein